MPYFPLFMDLTGKKIIVFGAGNVGYRKVKTLLKFNPNLTIISMDFNDKFDQLEMVTRITKEIELSDITEDTFMVIAATNDKGLNKKLIDFAHEKKILCDCATDVSLCDFAFPSVVVRGNVVAAVSTSKGAPSLSKYYRERFEEEMPECLDELESTLRGLRDRLEAEGLESKTKRNIYEKIIKKTIILKRNLINDEIDQIISEEKGSGV